MDLMFYFGSMMVQLMYGGMDLISKAALISGLNNYIFIFYRYAAGTIILVPTAFIFSKWNGNASFSWSCMGKVFGISLLGTIVTWSFNSTIDNTSATFAAAAANCVPVTTFMFALLFRMEKVNVRIAGGIAKIVGIVACIAGVAILAFYKGHYFQSPFTHPFIQNIQDQLHPQPASSTKAWILGCISLVIAAIISGILLVLQARFLEQFPSTLVFSSLQSAMCTIQSLIIALVMVRDPSQRKLGWDIKLLSIAYCAIFIVVLGNILQCWVIKHKGPVFHAMTTPLVLVATIIGSAILFSQGIYFGSILGAVLLISGLYCVLWGKSKDAINTLNTQHTP